MQIPKFYTLLTFNIDQIVNEQDIIQALAKYEVLEAPNYTEITKKYNLVFFILM